MERSLLPSDNGFTNFSNVYLKYGGGELQLCRQPETQDPLQGQKSDTAVPAAHKSLKQKNQFQ